MLITLEQQQALIDNYVKAKHTIDECLAFIEGVEKTMELIGKLDKCNNNVKLCVKNHVIGHGNCLDCDLINDCKDRKEY